MLRHSLWKREMTDKTKLTLATFYALLSLAVVGALQFGYFRPVKAEDDCAMGTWAVERVPVVGLLVCIGEP